MCFRFSPFRVLTKQQFWGLQITMQFRFFSSKNGVWPLFAAIDTFKKTTINTYQKKTNKNWFELPNLRQTQILWKRGEWMCMMGLNRRLWRHADIFFRAIDFNEVIFDSEYLRIFADFIITNGGGATISYIW